MSNIIIKTTFEYGGCTQTKIERRTSGNRLIDFMVIDHEGQTATFHRRHGRDDKIVPFDDVMDELFDRFMDSE